MKMKKILIAAIVTMSALSASALEVGAFAGRTLNSADRNTFGVSVGQKFGDFKVTGSFDRGYSRQNDQNRYSLVGAYDFYKIGPVALNAQLGVAYLDNQASANGYAALIGIGGTVPITDKVSGFVDFRNQRAIQNRVSGNNGNSVVAGLKYSF